MPSKSKKQQSFFKVVYSIKKGDKPFKRGDKASEVSKKMTLSQIKDYITLK